MEISVQQASAALAASNAVFTELFKHGTLTVEFYKPDKIDHQKPHERDEVYVVVSDTGFSFMQEGGGIFKPGDFLFVPAGRNIVSRILRTTLPPGWFSTAKGGEQNSDY